MYSDDDNKEIEAKTPIVKSSSSGNGNGNGNGNYINYGKNSRKKWFLNILYISILFEILK